VSVVWRADCELTLLVSFRHESGSFRNPPPRGEEQPLIFARRLQISSTKERDHLSLELIFPVPPQQDKCKPD